MTQDNGSVYGNSVMCSVGCLPFTYARRLLLCCCCRCCGRAGGWLCPCPCLCMRVSLEVPVEAFSCTTPSSSSSFPPSLLSRQQTLEVFTCKHAWQQLRARFLRNVVFVCPVGCGSGFFFFLSLYFEIWQVVEMNSCARPEARALLLCLSSLCFKLPR